MYNYEERVCEDIRSYINSEIDLDDYKGKREELEDFLNEALWDNDSVTGNASGSYTVNAYMAEEYICHNLDLLKDACDAYGEDVGDAINSGAEYCDVTIRCYLLSNCISQVLDEMDI